MPFPRDWLPAAVAAVRGSGGVRDGIVTGRECCRPKDGPVLATGPVPDSAPEERQRALVRMDSRATRRPVCLRS
jgi:hypothetical protein